MMKKLLKINALIIIICFPIFVNAQDVKYSGGDGDGYSYSSYENKGVPGSFSAGAGVTAIQLTWEQNTDGDNVIIVYGILDSFGSPEDGQSYSVNDTFSGGGTIIYNGSGTSYLQTGLDATTTYYYKAWSVNGTTYSINGVTANATTQSLSVKYSGGDGDGYASAEASSAPLPVELISFEGFNTEDGVVLNWQTATEVNNYGFEILRSAQNDSHSEESIGFVQGNGTTNSPKQYSFTDDLTINPNLTQASYRLKQIDNDGTFAFSKTITVDLTTITDVNGNELPKVYSLSQNYPNPFNPTTTIKFGLPQSGFVDLRVYNILGEEVARLVNKELQAGYHEVSFGNINLPSGVYIYKINVENEFCLIKKMLLLK